MQKLITNTLKFLLLAFLCYVVGVVVWTHLIPFNFLKKNTSYPIGSKGYMFSRIAELDTIKNVDILFLGSSHTYRGFDPRIFQRHNLNSFNLGSASQTPMQTKYLLEKYLVQLNPKLVIYETYPATFENDGVEASLDFIANTSMHGSAFRMAFQLNHIKIYNTLIYDIFFEALHRSKGFRELEKKKDTYIKGGFVETSVVDNNSPITEQIKKRWKDQWKIKKYQWELFQENVALLENKGIPVVLVQMPVTTEAYQLYKNNEEIDSLIGQVGKYHNFNHNQFLDDTFDFMDYHHLNQSGVNKTNLRLIQLLKKEYPSLFPKDF